MPHSAAVPVGKQLARILQSASPLEGPASHAAHLAAIDRRRTQETEAYLRTCVLRLGNAGV